MFIVGAIGTVFELITVMNNTNFDEAIFFYNHIADGCATPDLLMHLFYLHLHGCGNSYSLMVLVLCLPC